MIILKQPLLPVNGYAAMMTLGLLWVRSDLSYEFTDNERLMNHERIHMYQQLEIAVLSLMISAGPILGFDLSWWWLTASPVIPLLIYVICWILEIFLPPSNSSYKNICFESESIYNEHKLSYCKSRIPFAWLWYISNTKYPYMSYTERCKLYPIES